MCNCIFTLSHQRRADSPEASADRWAALHILKVTKLNLFILFLSESGTNLPHPGSTPQWPSPPQQQTARSGAGTMTVRSVVAHAASDTASAACRPPLRPRSVSIPRKWDLFTLQKPNLVHEDDIWNVKGHFRWKSISRTKHFNTLN